MADLTSLTLTEMQAGLKQGDFSSRELVQAALDRIASLDPSLHAFLHVAADSALERADEADRQRKSLDPRDLPPLLGIPVAVKDVLSVEGLPCTCGSKILQGFVPPYTATSVQRLLQAGIVIVGKTNTDEFAMGSSTENSAYGVTHNPWDLERVPGGSSGGSAAAVAARFVPAALGTDTGGSVRQPASLCGVTGLKTTYGRVSRYGLVAFGSSLDTVGAFGRSARDVAAIFSVMAGRDPLDATSADVPVPPVDLGAGRVELSRPLERLRIGVPKEYFVEGIQPEVAESNRAAIEVLQSLGAQVREISLPHTEYALPVYYIIAPAEASANLARYDGVRYGPREEAGSMLEVYFRTRGHALRPGGDPPRDDRHLRPLGGLLRRLLRPGAEGAHAHKARFRAGLRAGGPDRRADLAQHCFQDRRACRRPARHVPGGCLHPPRQPGGRAGHLASMSASTGTVFRWECN